MAKKSLLPYLIILFCLNCSSQHETKTVIPSIDGKFFKGDSVNLRELAKGKLTLVNVWGIFCQPCMEELPFLHRIYDKYKSRKDFLFITLAADSEEELLKFLDPKDPTNPYRKMFLGSNLDSFYLPTLACLPHGYYFPGGEYPMPLDSSERSIIRKKFKTNAIPTTLIYDQFGKLILKQIGTFDDTTILEKKLENLFQEK